jgi:hypothetical protein
VASKLTSFGTSLGTNQYTAEHIFIWITTEICWRFIDKIGYTMRTKDPKPCLNGDHPVKRNLLILALLTACSSLAFAQASPDATRAGDLQAGGSFTFGYPDYSPQKAFGGGAYATFDFKTNWGAEFAFHEISLDTHSPAKELSYGLGPRYHRTYGRYNPYLKALGGRGSFTFNPNFIEGPGSQSYWMLVGGAGLDYQLSYRFNIRGEVEYQRWFTNATGDLPHGLTPIIYNFGFAYHFSGGAPTY